MIKVNQLRKEFTLTKRQKKELSTDQNKMLAVDNISFECEAGRVFSLLGPNGAGKTTTLRMLATIFKPSSGNIEIAGIDALKYPEEARKKIGFLTGSTGLYGRLTAEEVVRYFGRLYGVSNTEIDLRTNELFDLLDMNHFRKKQIGKLSTGMKQKVSICRTMIHDPEILIFDEPTSGLDVITAENIIKLVTDCKNKGKTVIFSSHIMGEVDLLSDDLAIIHNGKLLYKDTMYAFKENMRSDSLTQEFISIIQPENI